MFNFDVSEECFTQVQSLLFERGKIPLQPCSIAFQSNSSSQNQNDSFCMSDEGDYDESEEGDDENYELKVEESAFLGSQNQNDIFLHVR